MRAKSYWKQLEERSVGSDAKARFAHRRINSARFESICLQCFRTVGISDAESGLERIEARHVCSQEDLIQLHSRMEPKSIGNQEQRKERA